MSIRTTHPASIRLLRSELMCSTALSPTQHKSSKVGKIVGMVAGTVIPLASPAIASALSISGAIGSAIVGAGLGAAAAYVGGMDPLMGAAGGGIAGVIAGYQGTGRFMPGSAGSDTVSPLGSGVAPVIDRPGAGIVSGADTAGLTASSLPVAGESGALHFANAPSVAPSSFVTPGGAGFIENSSGQVFPLGQPTAATVPVLKTNVPANINAWRGAGVQAPDTMLSRAEAWAKSPKGIKALSTASSGAMGMAFTPEEQMSDLDKANMDALNADRAEKRRLAGIKEGMASELYRDASNINPDYYGRQAVVGASNRIARKDAGVRRAISSTNKNALASNERRQALAGVQAANAYYPAYDAAYDRRQKALTSAANLYPTGGSTADIQARMKISDAQYARQQEEETDLAQQFYPSAVGLAADDEARRREEERLNG